MPRMKQFETSIRIKAPPAAIWALLTDAPGFPRWNSTVERVDGRIALGEKVTVHVKMAPGRAFPVTVSELVPNARMVWRGGMPFGLFTGTRTYVLEPEAAEVVFRMREAFTGLMAPLITKSIPDLQPSFDRFAADLKAAAERAG